MVNHPAHYGGADNPYEAIKVIEAWGLGFCLGNTVKYISRAEKKGAALEDLRKAAWYLQREIERRTSACREDLVRPNVQIEPPSRLFAKVDSNAGFDPTEPTK